jgi:hypothetical protein
VSVDMPWPVRLYVDSCTMFVRLGGQPRKLETVPAISGLPLYTALDYVPKVIAEIQPVAARKRELSSWERECVLLWMLQAKGNW